jgi:hydrogenase expression/formation protein HypE
MKKDEKITLKHGSGGKLTHELIRKIFKKNFNNKFLDSLDDSAVIDLTRHPDRLCFTTDSYVVNPVFFPGGDIGKLSICGTVNDLAVMGAVPLYISCGFIIEEGLSAYDLERIVQSMKRAAQKAGVKVVTGDTKVVEKNACDNVYINTAGIGFTKGKLNLSLDSVKTGDKIIINGTIAEHGLAVLSARKEFGFENKISSDCASLNKLIYDMLSTGARVKFMRDPTRGGLAATLNEIVENKNFGILLDEKNTPVKNDVKTLCELLGFDPLYIANEGKVVVVVNPHDADKILNKMYNNVLGKTSRIIGEVTPGPAGKVIMKTSAGGSRIIDMPAGDQLPRIC